MFETLLIISVSAVMLVYWSCWTALFILRSRPAGLAIGVCTL